jgi:hypothetical protein
MDWLPATRYRPIEAISQHLTVGDLQNHRTLRWAMISFGAGDVDDKRHAFWTSNGSDGNDDEIHEAGSNWPLILAVLRKYHTAETKIGYSGVVATPVGDTLGSLETVPDRCALLVENTPNPYPPSITIERRQR